MATRARNRKFTRCCRRPALVLRGTSRCRRCTCVDRSRASRPRSAGFRRSFRRDCPVRSPRRGRCRRCRSSGCRRCRRHRHWDQRLGPRSCWSSSSSPPPSTRQQPRQATGPATAMRSTGLRQTAPLGSIWVYFRSLVRLASLRSSFVRREHTCMVGGRRKFGRANRAQKVPRRAAACALACRARRWRTVALATIRRRASDADKDEQRSVL